MFGQSQFPSSYNDRLFGTSSISSPRPRSPENYADRFHFHGVESPEAFSTSPKRTFSPGMSTFSLASKSPSSAYRYTSQAQPDQTSPRYAPSVFGDALLGRSSGKPASPVTIGSRGSLSSSPQPYQRRRSLSASPKNVPFDDATNRGYSPRRSTSVDDAPPTRSIFLDDEYMSHHGNWDQPDHHQDGADEVASAPSELSGPAAGSGDDLDASLFGDDDGLPGIVRGQQLAGRSPLSPFSPMSIDQDLSCPMSPPDTPTPSTKHYKPSADISRMPRPTTTATQSTKQLPKSPAVPVQQRLKKVSFNLHDDESSVDVRLDEQPDAPMWYVDEQPETVNPSKKAMVAGHGGVWQMMLNWFFG
ncbi:hypothetical protein HDU85_001761 [Gaertneriomyces sp. JEL0708]|nr:hypothetical protein HDU85_001761 [Gaertneriomyces sp. JEL0708]